MKFPYETLPTESLKPRLHAVTQQQTALPFASRRNGGGGGGSNEFLQSNKNSEPRQLDDETGLAILQLIENKDGSLTLKKKKSLRRQHRDNLAPLANGVGSEIIPMDTLDQVNNTLGIIVAKSNIKFITRELLTQNHITIGDLIRGCHTLSISDLRAAHLILSFDDLLQLDFKMSDIKIDPQRFAVSHLVTFFKVNYKQLRANERIKFGYMDLYECQFDVNELHTLSFSFEHLILRKALNKQQLLTLSKYSLADLMSLHFTLKAFRSLQITQDEALKHFKWAPDDYKQLLAEQQ
jgi:hypothetical protein